MGAGCGGKSVGFVLLMWLAMHQNETAQRHPHNEPLAPTFSPSVSLVLSFFFIVLSGLLVVNMVKSISTAYQRNLLLVQAEREVDELRIKNLELREKLDYVSSNEYVEQEARDQLQYAKDGETMVLLPEAGDESSEVLGANEDVGKDGEDGKTDDQADGVKGWDRWWNLLVSGV
jgi:cell division protein FtsB